MHGVSRSFALSCWLLAVVCVPMPAAAQHERDYINTDDEGHLIFRYAGSKSPEANAEQMVEINNAFASVMVHDRLRADILFDAEPVDAAWANEMESAIESGIVPGLPEHEFTEFQCRSETCRLILSESGSWTVSEHVAVMDEVQRVVQAFIRHDPNSFDSVFLMTAYFQLSETPDVTVYLRKPGAQ